MNSVTVDEYKLAMEYLDDLGIPRYAHDRSCVHYSLRARIQIAIAMTSSARNSHDPIDLGLKNALINGTRSNA